MKPHYQQTPEELFFAYDSGKDGLTTQQVAEHQEKYGTNKMEQGKKKPVWVLFLEQFKDFLVIILIIAALISAVMNDIESFVVIIAVITMNAILGTVQTVKAEKSLADLKQLSAPTATVLRDGVHQVIPAEELTVGDVVLLEAGNQIPADGRFLECASLQTNESALTGESLNVEKSVEPITQEVPLGDRHTMGYSGSFVTYGRGTMLVTDIGAHTEVGKIATMIQNAEERKTPLQRTLDQFGKRLSIGILIVCALVFGLSIWRAWDGGISRDELMDGLLFAIALAVAAIPEALSSIVTIVLSFGTQKMAREHAIMRKLQAVEGLGSVSVICSDKTGTLTQNRMTVRKVVAQRHIIAAEDVRPSDPAEYELLAASILCSDAVCRNGEELGDPTETALVRFGQQFQIDADTLRQQRQRISEVPFDSDRKLMSTLVRTEQGAVLYTKGAADVMIHRMQCSAEEIQEIQDQVALLSRQGRKFAAQRSFFFGEIETRIIADGGFGDGHHRPVGVGEQRRHLHQLAFVEVFVVGLRVESLVRSGVRREIHRQRFGISCRIERRQFVVHHIGVPALLLGKDIAESRAVVERAYHEINPAMGCSLFQQRDHGFGVRLLDMRGFARNEVVTLHAAATLDASGAEPAAEFAAVEDEAHAASVDELCAAVEYVVFRQRFPVHADRHANQPVG